jgi:hypothetical protein
MFCKARTDVWVFGQVSTENRSYLFQDICLSVGKNLKTAQRIFMKGDT